MYQYTYDAFNRLVGAAKAYRDSSDVVQTGSTLCTYVYDGQHRRISREVQNSGALDSAGSMGDVVTYKYAGDRLIAEYYDGGFNYPHKQYVWGLSYIDELIEVEVVKELAPTAYESYYAVLDSKYCVMGLVDDTGAYVERYEYTPDGRRQVYISAGTNDPDAQTPTSEASRRLVTWYPTTLIMERIEGYALCTIGFQGLMHDEITGNIYQRAREYSTRLGRFLQRDPLGYPDGMNTYAAYHVMRGGMDPMGMRAAAGAETFTVGPERLYGGQGPDSGDTLVGARDPNGASRETDFNYHGRSFVVPWEIPQDVIDAEKKGCLVISELQVSWRIVGFNSNEQVVSRSKHVFWRSFKGVLNFSGAGIGGHFIFSPMANSGGVEIRKKWGKPDALAGLDTYVDDVDVYNQLNPNNQVDGPLTRDQRTGVIDYVKNTQRNQQTWGNVGVYVVYHVYNEKANDQTNWNDSKTQHRATTDGDFSNGGMPNRFRSAYRVLGKYDWVDKDKFSVQGDAPKDYFGAYEFQWDWRPSNKDRPIGIIQGGN